MNKKKELNFCGIYDFIGRSYFRTGGIYEIFSVKDLIQVRKDDKEGFIDHKGNLVIPLIYDDVSDFAKCGLARVRQNGKYGFINRVGVVIIPIIYDDAEDFFNEDLTTCKLKDKCYLINKKGKIII